MEEGNNKIYLELEGKIIKLEEELSRSKLLLNELIKFYIDPNSKPEYWVYSRSSVSGLIKASKDYVDASVKALNDLDNSIKLLGDTSSI